MEHDKHIREVEEQLYRECRGLSSVGTIQYLVRHGLLSYPNIKAHLARERVKEAMRKEGLGKLDAIELVAQQMGCSNSTIRNYVYARNSH